MRYFLMLVMGVVLAGCSILPIRTVGVVEEESGVVEEGGMTLAPEEVLEVGLAYDYSEPVLVKQDQIVMFRNSQTKAVEVKFMLDREITQELPAGGTFSYKYTYGGDSVEFSWDGGGVTLNKVE